MKVNFEGNNLLIDWSYKTKKAVIEGVGHVLQDVTICYARDGKDDEIGSVSITRFNKDNNCKEKARTISLKKLVDTLYPGKENKDIRASIWKSYRSRNQG